MRIQPSDVERKQGQLSPTNLNLALRLLREVGAVILEGAVPLEVVGEVRNAYFDAIRAGQKMKIGPPQIMPYYDPQIIANSFALQVVEAAMGKKINLAMYFIHAIPPHSGSDEGPHEAHRDGNHLFPEVPLVLPVSGIYVDIPLVDFAEENGATRIWPGSHLIVDQPPSDVVALSERAQHMPSVQMAMPLGSLSLRDMRLWHGGMPNKTDTIRAMLDIGYVRVFPHAGERIWLSQEIKKQLPKSAQKLLKTGVLWLPQEIKKQLPEATQRLIEAG